ncbi:MAG: cupin domain-containing protein [Thermoguttaceae bacterium]
MFAGEGEPRLLGAGDHVRIPAGKRHRVEWTSPREPTVWLAVFYEEGF